MTGRRETGRKEMGDKERGRKEMGRKEKGGKKIGAKERGVESGVEETGGKKTRVKAIGVVNYKYRPIGNFLQGANTPGLTYYQTDYLRVAPKVMKWCRDHRVPPAPDNLHVPKNVPMEKHSVAAMTYIRHAPCDYLSLSERGALRYGLATGQAGLPNKKAKKRQKCAHNFKQPPRSTYRPDTEKPKKKPLCRCAEEVLQVHREDVNSQMGADAGAKASPPPSQPSQRERSIAWADECTCVPVPVATQPTAARTPPCSEETQALEQLKTLREQEDIMRTTFAGDGRPASSAASTPANRQSRAAGGETHAQVAVRAASVSDEAPVQKSASASKVKSPPQVLSPTRSTSMTGAKSPLKPASRASSRSRCKAKSLSPEEFPSPCEDTSLARSEANVPLFIQGRPPSHESDVSIELATRVCRPYGPYGEYPLQKDRRPHRPTPDASLGTHVTRPPHGTGAAWYPMDLHFNPKLGIFIGNAAH
ncbi:hypothetical protein LSAT2_030978 [Lamellibrachia satsuma]|nr:hypothetical protein LSAT2_030978 [Lamellibrachia satsuma]